MQEKYSNCYASLFILDKTQCNSTEHYMQYQKLDIVAKQSLLMQNNTTLGNLRSAMLCAADIAVELSRERHFSKGPSLKNLLPEAWHEGIKRYVLLKENFAKFTQDIMAKWILLHSEDKIIIGLATNPANFHWSIAKRKGLFGLNWAGEISMDVRQLMQNVKL